MGWTRSITGVGTGGHLTGVARVLKAKFPQLKVFAVEPKESAVISGGLPPHAIQGLGAGFIPKNLDASLLDSTIRVEAEAAREYARRAAAQEGLLVGISSGATLAARRPKIAGYQPAAGCWALPTTRASALVRTRLLPTDKPSGAMAQALPTACHRPHGRFLLRLARPARLKRVLCQPLLQLRQRQRLGKPIALGFLTAIRAQQLPMGLGLHPFGQARNPMLWPKAMTERQMVRSFLSVKISPQTIGRFSTGLMADVLNTPAMNIQCQSHPARIASPISAKARIFPMTSLISCSKMLSVSSSKILLGLAPVS